MTTLEIQVEIARRLAILEAADTYQRACEAVQPLWRALLLVAHEDKMAHTATRFAAGKAYFEASEKARAAHKELIRLASGGHMETGV